MGQRAASRLGDSLGWKFLRKSRAPLDPHRIANLEEIEVVRASVLGESGRIEWTNTGLRVTLRKTDGLQRQRFTLAHELGHHFIFGIAKDQGRRYSPEEEIRCDRFAAALLMPKKAFVEAYNDQQLSSRVTAVRSLADRFDVSLQATIRRLNELGIVDPSVILLLIDRGPDGPYRVAAAWYDTSVYRRIEGMTTNKLRIEHTRSAAMATETESSRIDASAWLPAKRRGFPRDFYSIVPVEMTCVRLRRNSRQSLVELKVVVDPLRPAFHRKPSDSQAKFRG